jgi:hypothetical protein
MSLRGLQTRVKRVAAKLPPPEYCACCAPLFLVEADGPHPPPGPCRRCGKWPPPGTITCVVVVKPD